MRDVWRIIDANLNRAREGLRVIEETVRFLLNDAELMERVKTVRHSLAVPLRPELLAARDIQGDIGTAVEVLSESERESLAQLLTANCKRVQEALRVLEEYSKLVGIDHSPFKQGRYQAYDLEKALYERLNSANKTERWRS